MSDYVFKSFIKLAVILFHFSLLLGHLLIQALFLIPSVIVIVISYPLFLIRGKL